MFSAALPEFTKQFEGCRLMAYKDPAGVPTIGFGHTGKDVYVGLMWDQCTADQHLLDDLTDANALLLQYSSEPFPVGAEDALTDFVFNLGIGNYRTSTLRKYVDTQDWVSVKKEILLWDHCCGIVMPGLQDRRQAEADLIQVPSA